jgi:uncharacterized protein (DUF1499 family)
MMIHREITHCPGTPNCVCSIDTDRIHGIDPITFHGTQEEAEEKIKHVIATMERSKIVKSTGDYVHAEFKSKLFGFVDDVEFFIDEKGGLIQVHSESRTGIYDFGVNRKRVEEIRHRFEDKDIS